MRRQRGTARKTRRVQQSTQLSEDGRAGAGREREKDEGQILTMVKYFFHPFVTVVAA